ncbi:hypothetical protein CTAYLR_010316 [Chrysophaeum taylorii]|uniref:Uncharacterized protein n=1 Tax=Chrysophaeum taylorii TaxID=2483200 RepID=A0AAD7XNK9_9STRA|nr:hypothetical protein CTAYLR_010316 [Chrysophaeum taylorii]
MVGVSRDGSDAGEDDWIETIGDDDDDLAHNNNNNNDGEWTLVQRERSDSLRSTVSSYSYYSSCTDDVAAAEGRLVEPFDGRLDEARRYDEAIAASLQDAEHSDYFAPRSVPPPRPAVAFFFSATGAPLDVQLRAATNLSVFDLDALHATCKWTRVRLWRVVTSRPFGPRGPRVEALPLAEAAAATLLVRHLGFDACLPATLETAGYAKRLALSRAVVVVPPKFGTVHVAASATKCAALANDPTHRDALRLREFDDPNAFRAAALRELLGLVALRGPPAGPPAWLAYLTDIKHASCRLKFIDAFDGWVPLAVVRRLPFPVRFLDRDKLQDLDKPRFKTLLAGATNAARHDDDDDDDEASSQIPYFNSPRRANDRRPLVAPANPLQLPASHRACRPAVLRAPPFIYDDPPTATVVQN